MFDREEGKPWSLIVLGGFVWVMVNMGVGIHLGSLFLGRLRRV